MEFKFHKKTIFIKRNVCFIPVTNPNGEKSFPMPLKLENNILEVAKPSNKQLFPFKINGLLYFPYSFKFATQKLLALMHGYGSSHQKAKRGLSARWPIALV